MICEWWWAQTEIKMLNLTLYSARAPAMFIGLFCAHVHSDQCSCRLTCHLKWNQLHLWSYSGLQVYFFQASTTTKIVFWQISVQSFHRFQCHVALISSCHQMSYELDWKLTAFPTWYPCTKTVNSLIKQITKECICQHTWQRVTKWSYKVMTESIWITFFISWVTWWVGSA